MTRAPLITIIIVNYKTPVMTCEVVDAAKRCAETDNVAIHVCVVDNGSEDGSVQSLRAAHPDIEVIDAGSNLGFAAGNNLALKKLSTPYAMLLNSDAFPQTGALRRLVDFMERNPHAGAAGPRILNPDGTDQDCPYRFPTISQMAARALTGPQFPAAGKDPQRPLALERIHGCCLVMKKEALEKAGFLDEQFFMYDEDVDWCLRCRKAGWKIFLLPDAAVIHLGGQSSGRAPSGRRKEKTLRAFNPRLSYELRKSRYILYRKHKNALETATLKALTDAMLAAGCVMSFPALAKSGASRENAIKKLKTYISIMAINPFRLKVRA